MEPHVQ